MTLMGMVKKGGGVKGRGISILQVEDSKGLEEWVGKVNLVHLSE